MTQKTALITGVTGQDGSYLAEFLLEKGYAVHGIKRRASSFNTERIDHIYQDPHSTGLSFSLHYGDLTDSSNITRIIQQVQPDEIYNLGAQSHVAVSFEQPEYTADVDGLGNLDARRDWGHDRDYVEMQWLMLQQDKARDFVIATGQQTSVRDFIERSARQLGITLHFEGSGTEEKGIVDSIDKSTADPAITLKPGDTVVAIDPRYYRPAEVETLLGDPSRAPPWTR
jgi:GDP-D-mannose dehydratase